MLPSIQYKYYDRLTTPMRHEEYKMKRPRFCVVLTLYHWILGRRIIGNATINYSERKRQELCRILHQLLHKWTRCSRLLSLFATGAWFHITQLTILEVGWYVPTETSQWMIEWATSQIKLYVVKTVEGNALIHLDVGGLSHLIVDSHNREFFA